MGELTQELRGTQGEQFVQASLAHHIGYDLMGPVVHRWLLGLHQYLQYLDDGKTAFLFSARAGVRIERLYRLFCNELPCYITIEPQLFWISRFSVAKGTYGRKNAQERALDAMAHEYFNQPLTGLINGLLRHNPDHLKNLDLQGRDLKVPGRNFPSWIKAIGPTQSAVRSYLEECTAAFDSYLMETLAGKSRAVLIDSGWQGSTQSLLARAHPEYDWKGIYFGRILTDRHDSGIAHDVIGLMFENETYDPKIPESAFVRHRHLIESLLEPNGPSIEEIPAGRFFETAEKMITANREEKVDPQVDFLFLSATRYLQDHAGSSISEIISRHQRAMPELARIITTPLRSEAKALVLKHRSADFGKTLVVPVLSTPDARNPEEKDRRIRESLWPEGQIALEYDGGIALDLQRRLNGLINDAVYFDPLSVDKERMTAATSPMRPKVAIITRTKNRPLLLQRAAMSVASQTFDDYVWIVINDGGDEAVVRATLDESLVDRRKVRMLSYPESLGMEAASNAGIRASDSDFVVIHDDDDSWASGFLAKAVEFLESAGGARYGGVITHSTYVSEEIRGDKVIEHGRWPYQDWVRNVQLAEMACGNFFPPIAFTFRRPLWEKVGGYNESLPVLGDWFFNLEFLLHADIFVLPEPLAFYHHRDRGDSRAGLYANSVIGGRSKHDEFSAVARNEFLRRHARETSAALSVVLGYVMSDIRRKVGKTAGAPSIAADTCGYDLLDLYWTAAQVNRFVAEGGNGILSRLRGTGGSPVDPASGWGTVLSLLHKLKTKIPPPDSFDEDAYLCMNEDVAAAVRSGEQRSGYLHYLSHGRSEGRMRPGRKER